MSSTKRVFAACYYTIKWFKFNIRVMHEQWYFTHAHARLLTKFQVAGFLVMLVR